MLNLAARAMKKPLEFVCLVVCGLGAAAGSARANTIVPFSYQARGNAAQTISGTFYDACIPYGETPPSLPASGGAVTFADPLNCGGKSATIAGSAEGPAFSLSATSTAPLSSEGPSYGIEGDVNASFTNAGVFWAANGAGAGTLNLLDTIFNSADWSGYHTSPQASVVLTVEWGDYDPITGISLISNRYQYEYDWANSFSYCNTAVGACLGLNQTANAVFPLTIASGQAVILQLDADLDVQGGTATLSDPLTVQLSPGERFDSLNPDSWNFPVTYTSPVTTPEPASLWLLGGGLLLSLGLGVRRLA